MQEANRKRRPNVVVFFTDQQRWDTTGIHGNPLGLTPNFDRMASFGTDVHYSFTCQPVCAPARSCLQSGMYATKTGLYRNDVIALPSQTRTLAHYFRDAGYHTGYIGKWHLGLTEEQAVAPERRGGYQYWLAANALELCSDAYHTVVYDNDCREVKLPGYRVDALTDAAIRYMKDHREEPFFLFLSHLEPHHQNNLDDYPPPNGYRSPYTGRWAPPDLQTLGGSSGQHLGGYYGMVKRLDEALGRVLDAIESLDLADDTIVMFSSDHGSHFKTRNDEYKRSCHESSIRVPTAFAGPGFNGGGRIGKLVSLIDLPPTILDAAGIEVPPDMQGRSMMPLLRGGQAEWPDEVFVQISESCVGRAIRTRRWKYAVRAPGKNGYEHMGSDVYQEEFLYDLQADPYELNNLAGIKTYDEVSAVLRERLLARMKSAGEEPPRIEPAPVRDPEQMLQPYWWRGASAEDAKG